MNQTFKIVMLSLFVSIAGTLCGQVSPKKGTATNKQKPVYYEIDAAMRQYVKDSLRYPDDAPAKGLSSSIVVRFIINKQGEIENPTLVRKGHPACDAEALRLVKAMPKREPTGRSACYMLPITFSPNKLKNADKEVAIPSSCTDQEEECAPSRNEVYEEGDDGLEMASFPGGMQSLFQFIGSNLQYPVEAQDSGIQGRVVVQFLVEKSGEISDIKLRRSVHPLCDKEALRVVKMMPKWYPAKMKGQLVRVNYILPIIFRLKD